MRSAALTWIEPGASATLFWHGATATRPGEGRRQLAIARRFATARVRDECGAETAGTFFWTAHRPDAVRVCVLIHNDAGVRACRLHPFELAKETA
jgi:hypothetical protein